MILKLGIFGNFLWVPLDLGQNCLLVILILHKFILVSPKKNPISARIPNIFYGLKENPYAFSLQVTKNYQGFFFCGKIIYFDLHQHKTFVKKSFLVKMASNSCTLVAPNINIHVRLNDL